VYVGNCQYKDKILDLLALMGVTIITEDRISTDYEEKEETKELKDILFGKLSPLIIEFIFIAKCCFDNKIIVFTIRKSDVTAMIEMCIVKKRLKN